MKVLIIAAHMDDCELMFGGIVHNLVSAGYDVEYLIVTDSASWVHPIAASAIDRGDIFLIRKDEQEKAAAILKVKCVHYLNFSDGYLFEQTELGLFLLEKIREISPDYIFTHSDKEFHGDHVTLTKLVKTLCNSIDEPLKITNPFFITKCKYLGSFNGLYQQARLEELSNVQIRFFSLSEENINKKVEALRCFRSQFYDMDKLSEKIWNEARFLGQLVGKSFAELIKINQSEKYKVINQLQEG